MGETPKIALAPQPTNFLHHFKLATPLLIMLGIFKFVEYSWGLGCFGALRRKYIFRVFPIFVAV